MQDIKFNQRQLNRINFLAPVELFVFEWISTSDSVPYGIDYRAAEIIFPCLVYVITYETRRELQSETKPLDAFSGLLLFFLLWIDLHLVMLIVKEKIF